MFSLEQGRKQQRSCIWEPELPADHLFGDSVEDWSKVSGHVVYVDFIYLIRESESSFGIKLDWTVMMDGDWDILRVLASPPLLRLFKCTGWCGQFFMRKKHKLKGGSPEFHVPLWPCFPFFFPCYSLLIILLAQSTREKSKLCDHFSQNNFVFKGVV